MASGAGTAGVAVITVRTTIQSGTVFAVIRGTLLCRTVAGAIRLLAVTVIRRLATAILSV